MSEMIIRPTMKFIYLGYAAVAVIVVALVVAMMDSLVVHAPSAVAREMSSPPALYQVNDPR
jgi:hypothetical protein